MITEKLRSFADLTADEVRVVGYLMAGYTDEDIARGRGVRVDSVRRWVSGIMAVLPSNRRHRHVLVTAARAFGFEAIPLPCHNCGMTSSTD